MPSRTLSYWTFTWLIATASLASVVFFWRENLLLSIILSFLAVLMWSIKRSRTELKVFVFCAFGGGIAESAAIASGAWTYGNPDIIGIPVWLIILWGIASMFIVRLYLSFKD